MMRPSFVFALCLTAILGPRANAQQFFPGYPDPLLPTAWTQPPKASDQAATTAGLCSGQWRHQCARMCDAGRPLSCARLAVLYASGAESLGNFDAYKVQLAAAVRSWSRACGLGHAASCPRAATPMLDGRVKGNPSPLLERGCNRGAAEACWHLAVAASKAGKHKRARRLERRACRHGFGRACERVANRGQRDAKLFTGMGKGGKAKRWTQLLDCPDSTREFRRLVRRKPERFCASGGAKPVRHGPSIRFASMEDEALGWHGRLSERGRYLQGRRDGLWASWTPTGKPNELGVYLGGAKHGVWMAYMAGKLWQRETFRRGSRHGPYRSQVDGIVTTGNHRNGKRHGVWVTTVIHRSIVEETTYDSRGRITGRRTFGLGRRLLGDESYRDGKRHGVAREWHENGVLSMRQRWVDGLPDGPHESFYPNGKVRFKQRFRRGRRLGVWISVFPDGTLKSRKEFDTSGRRTGRWAFWYPNGRKHAEGDVRDLSSWKAWDVDGTPMDEDVPILLGDI